MSPGLPQSSESLTSLPTAFGKKSPRGREAGCLLPCSCLVPCGLLSWYGLAFLLSCLVRCEIAEVSVTSGQLRSIYRNILVIFIFVIFLSWQYTPPPR
jgi:hypothetical protein